MIAPGAVTIVIPAHNNLAYSRICIESLQRNTPPGYRLVLVDNGSTDGSPEYFDTASGAEVVRHTENLGFAAGVNAGLRRAEGHALILNNDTYLPPGWFEPLLAVLDADPKAGLVGPVSNHVSGPQLIDGLSLDSPAAIEAYGSERARTRAGQTRAADRLVGFCMLIRGACLADIGLFDERFGLGNFEDDDYGRRAIAAGYSLRIADASFVYHFGHRTFHALAFTPDDFDALLAENAAKYADKWNMALEETGYPQTRALYLHGEGLALIDAGDRDGALAALVAAVTAYPHFALGHNDLGALLWELGEHERAVASFERALRLCPGYAEAQANLRDARNALGIPAEGAPHGH